MMFTVGQKVVCIDDGPSVFAGTASPLCKNKIYTVTKSWHCQFWDWPCVLVAEVDPPGGYAHNAKRFRPLIERKTDISFAHEILRKASKKAPALSESSGDRQMNKGSS